MLLFTPLSQDDAARAVDGLGLPDDVYFFVDHPVVDEAHDDTEWIVIDAPERDVIAFESPITAALGYREFAIPGAVASRFPARRGTPR